MAATAVLFGCPPPGTPPAPVERGVVAWVIGGKPSFESLRRNLGTITVVSPAYYKVEIAGDKTRLGDWDPQNPVNREAVRALARERGVPLVPLVACIGRCAKDLSAILSDETRAAAHLELIMAETAPDRGDGLFIDYEGLTCSAAAFSRFIDRLARELHRRGQRLGLAITEPCGASRRCGRAVYPFDIKHLVGVVDYLAVMEYDYTVDGSDAVAPRDWVARGLRRLRAEVSSQQGKVYVGLPFYGRISAGLAPDTGVLWSEVKRREIQGQAFRITQQAFDADKLCHVAQIAIGPQGRTGTLHYDDHTSLDRRLQLVQEHGFTKIAIWRLGGEDPDNWPVIRKWLTGRRPRKKARLRSGAPGS